MFSARNTGSCNDCTAWERSRLKEAIDAGRLDGKFFFIGDDGFTCEDQFVTPWSGTGIGIAKDSFNYHLSVRRQVIEEPLVFKLKDEVFFGDLSSVDSTHGH